MNKKIAGKTLSVYFKNDDLKLLDSRLYEATVASKRPVHNESEFIIKHFRLACATPISAIIGDE